MLAFSTLITRGYRSTQHDRIHASVAKIEARDPSRPGRVIPDAADLAVNDGRCLEAAILFLDISGFTSRPQETQEQQASMLRALAIFFTEMVRVIEDFGGTVEKNTGDGLMAYFTRQAGDDITAEHRAVAAALSMFDAAALEIDSLLVARGGAPLSFRICIDSGTVTIARLGAAQRFNGIVAIGTVANLACKMLHVAAAGEIMIGNNVFLGLPAEWRQHAWRSDVPTGYTYRLSGEPYFYWYYHGRWAP